jgi:LPS-assembly protein
VSAALTATSAFADDFWGEPSCPSPATGDARIYDARVAPAEDEPIRLESDSGEGDASGAWTLNGNVTVRHGDRHLHTEHAYYDPERERVTVDGTVEYIDPQLRLRGRDAQYEVDGAAEFADAEVLLPARNVRGAAERIAVHAEGDVDLLKVSITTCPRGNDDWLIRASRLHIDREASTAVGRDVRLDFFGVPILYAPVLSFPIGNERKSGFLIPDIGTSSRNGAEISAPWYWNIAPSYDATFIPTWFSERGAKLDTEFRYLSENNEAWFYGEYLPSDAQFGGSRSFLRLTDRIDLAPRLRLTLDGANVSDDRWFEDFGRGTDTTSILYLNRSASLAYIADRWQVSALTQNFQTIDHDALVVDPASQPYTLLPQVWARGSWPNRPLGLTYAFEGELTYFDRRVGVTGLRIDAQPELRLPLRRPGVFVEPAVAWRYTAYDLDGVAADANDSPDRSLPIVSVDTGVILERNAGPRGRWLQTLEPRLLYVYAPYRDQSELPVFGTTVADLSLVQLFRTNRYIGVDRVSDANQVSIGVTSRLIDSPSGTQLLSATLGEIIYLKQPRVTLPGEAPPSSGTAGPIAELSLTPHRKWSVGLGLQWNSTLERTDRSDITVRYFRSPQHVVNLSYRQLAGYRLASGEELRQVDASAAWPVTRSVSAFGRVVYSIEEGQVIDQFAGLEYRACCWRVRLVGRQYLRNRLGDTDTSVLLQLELNGLSNVGFAAAEFLEESIRGYSSRAAK